MSGRAVSSRHTQRVNTLFDQDGPSLILDTHTPSLARGLFLDRVGDAAHEQRLHGEAGYVGFEIAGQRRGTDLRGGIQDLP